MGEVALAAGAAAVRPLLRHGLFLAQLTPPELPLPEPAARYGRQTTLAQWGPGPRQGRIYGSQRCRHPEGCHLQARAPPLSEARCGIVGYVYIYIYVYMRM